MFYMKCVLVIFHILHESLIFVSTLVKGKHFILDKMFLYEKLN